MARSKLSQVTAFQSKRELSRVRLEPATMETFVDDETGYREWLYGHLSGYGVNALRGANPGEPMLHRATCDWITPTPDKVWTSGEYIKVCSTDRFELDAWGRSGKPCKPCEFCNP